MPRVSVIIPTLNRAHLLRSALRSAIEQEYEDIEILVSDDCSDDDTQAVATSTGDERVRHVRTPKRLDMAQSFEFAMHQARGELLTFLTDDSYLTTDCIRRAVESMDAANVPLVVWRHAGYFDQEWIEPQRRNTMYVPACSYQDQRLDSRASLARWFRDMRAASASMPRSINSLCDRRVIESVLKTQGSFFLPPAPDHSSGVGMLLHTDSYILVDEPLVVDGVTKESIGPSQSFSLGPSAQAFYSSFAGTMEEVTFLGLPTTPAIIARSFENVRAHHAEAPPLDARRLVVEMVDSIAKLEVYGSDVRALWTILDAYLDKQPIPLRRLSARARIAARARWHLVKFVRSTPSLGFLESLRGLDVLRGSRVGFTDIAGAARELERQNVKKREARA